jgi:hypothetical protein
LRGHFAEPVETGGLEADGGVDPSGDSAVDDQLSLLLQQLDQPLLGADVAADAAAQVVEGTCNKRLFGGRRDGNSQHPESFASEVRYSRLVVDGVKPSGGRDRAHRVLEEFVLIAAECPHAVKRILYDKRFREPSDNSAPPSLSSFTD